MNSSEQIQKGIAMVCSNTQRSSTASPIEVARTAFAQMLPDETCRFALNDQFVMQAKAIVRCNECVRTEVVRLCGTVDEYFNDLQLFLHRHRPVHGRMTYRDWKNAMTHFEPLVSKDTYNLFAAATVKELVLQSRAAIAWARSDIMGYCDPNIARTVVERAYARLQDFTTK